MYLYTASEYKGESHRTRKEKKTPLFAVVRIGSFIQSPQQVQQQRQPSFPLSLSFSFLCLEGRGTTCIHYQGVGRSHGLINIQIPLLTACLLQFKIGLQMYLADILCLAAQPLLCLLFSWGCKNDEDSDFSGRRLEQNLWSSCDAPDQLLFSTKVQKFLKSTKLKGSQYLTSHWLEIWKKTRSLYGTEWRERGYGLGQIKEIMLATVPVLLHEWSHIKQQPRARGLLFFYLFLFQGWGHRINNS